MTCRCGSELPKQSGRGRPQLYCSSACRRVAEFEIRTISRRIADLEETASLMRISITAGDHTSWAGWGRPRKALPAVEAEIAVQQGRLKVLLERGQARDATTA